MSNLIESCAVCGNHPTCVYSNQFYKEVRKALFDSSEDFDLEKTLKRIKELRAIEEISRKAIDFGIDIFRRIMK